MSWRGLRHYTVDDDGRLTLAKDAPVSAMRAVASVKHKVRTIPQGRDKPPRIEREVEFTLWNKNKALEHLAKHTGVLLEPEKSGDFILNVNVVDYTATILAPRQERSAEPDPQPRLQALPPRNGRPDGGVAPAEPDASAPGVSYVPARWG